MPSSDTTLSIAGHRLKITHRDKVFWPDDGTTKGDLIGYYDRMAVRILPYLKGRPESLHRHPDGIAGGGFYQKDVDHQPPGWVKTKSIPAKSVDKRVNYLICDDKATLLYLANLGCIELNPWLSRTGPGKGRLDKPDFLLIDLDAKTSEFGDVVDVAREIRKLLEEVGVPSYPKTSGKSGLHICVPLGAKYDYKQSRRFAEVLMRFTHRRCPDLTSLERSPDKRKGRVYLDYLQNARGQTMAAPYCVRPVADATVSTPLKWDEVGESLDPKDFTITNIEGRVKDVGDLWKPVLGTGVDLQRALGKLERLG